MGSFSSLLALRGRGRRETLPRMPTRSLGNRLRTLNVLLHPQRLFYAPDWIVLAVNNACNLHCRMCDVGAEFEGSNFYRNLMGSSPLNMPIDLVRGVVDQAAAAWPRVSIGFAFTEPLAYPPIVEAVRLASSRGLKTSVTTNGLTLTPHAEGLVGAGLRHLMVSLDGPPAIHNQIRGHKASFEKAIEGIGRYLDHASRASAPTGVSVFCTITEWNIGHLEEFLEILRPLRLEQVGLMHTSFVTEETAREHNLSFGPGYPATASNLSAIDLQAMDLDRLWEELGSIEARRWPWPLSLSPRLESRARLEVYYREPSVPVGQRCNDTFSKMLIQSNGDVLPAAGRCFNVRVGNLHERSLPEIWNGEALGTFRKTLVDEGGLLPACSRCCAAYG